jgi:hypothetical protein
MRLRYAKVAQTMARTANIRHLVFLRELPQVGDPFFAALAVRPMVVRPWQIAASTDAES